MLEQWQVISIVGLVGIIMCLHGATKISHRAQGIASVASRWHAYVTCNSNEASQVEPPTNGGNSEASNPTGALPMYYSESDLESTDYVPIPTNTQLASYMSLYHKRQSFGTYVERFITFLLYFVCSISSRARYGC